MSEWQQQQPQQQQQAAAAPLPQGARIDSMPDGHGVGGTSSGRNLQLDLYHFLRTIPGILKLVEFVFGITCIALAAPALEPGTHWFLFVTVTAMLVTFFWIIIYIFTIQEAITLPWALIVSIQFHYIFLKSDPSNHFFIHLQIHFRKSYWLLQVPSSIHINTKLSN